MDTNTKMKTLLLDASGAGKSTLIKAISGAKILSTGESGTKRTVYESDTWILEFIDTKVFEYNLREQRKEIKQVCEYSKR